MESINYRKIYRLANAITLRDELAINDTYYLAHVAYQMIDTYHTPDGIKRSLTSDRGQADHYKTWADAEDAISAYLAASGCDAVHSVERVDARRLVGDIVDRYDIRPIGDGENVKLEIHWADDWMKARARELKPVIVQYFDAVRTVNELLESLTIAEDDAYQQYVEARADAADRLRSIDEELLRKAQPKAARQLRSFDMIGG